MTQISREPGPVVSLSARATAALVALIVLLAPATPVVLASDSPSVPSTPSATEQKTPEQLAVEHYNEGVINRDQARKLEKKLAAAPADKQEKMERKIEAAFKFAIREFREAVRQNPAMYQAYSGLGYALRRTGDFDGSLAAYDQALALEPNYTEAIEYRAEAYLALNRIDEAKAAYDTLVKKNQEHAAELLEAMKVWIQTRKSDPAGVTTQQVMELERWIETRATTMSDTVGHAMPRKGDRW